RAWQPDTYICRTTLLEPCRGRLVTAEEDAAMGAGDPSGYWQRRLPRRKALGATAGAGLAAAALATVGCGDDDNNGGAATGTAAANAQPRRGGTLTVMNATAFANNDPHLN